MQASSDTTARLVRLEAYLREDPGNATLLAETVMVALESGAAERAEAILASAPASIAGDIQIEHARGMVALAQHRFSDAIAVFDSLLHSGVAESTVRFNLAYALFRSGEHAQAAQHLQQLLSEPDAPAETLAYLMRCHHHAGEPAKALDTWKAAPARLKTAQAMAVASLACLDEGRTGDALSLADDALSGAASPVEALVVRATLGVGAGETALATQLLERAIAQAPEDGRVWSAMGMAWLAQGDAARAEEGFRRASRFMPGHIGTWLALGWCQILRKDLTGAQASLEVALSIDRNFGETHGGLAVLAALQGRQADARQAIERAQRLGRSGFSAQYAEAILKGEATDPVIIQTLARRLLRGRPGPDGETLLERALQAALRTGQ